MPINQPDIVPSQTQGNCLNQVTSSSSHPDRHTVFRALFTMCHNFLADMYDQGNLIFSGEFNVFIQEM